MAAYENDLSRLVEELNRSTPGAKSAERSSLDQLLTLAAQRDASDVLLVVGSVITLRIHGVLTPAATKPLSSDEIRSLLLPLLTSASCVVQSEDFAPTSTTSAARWQPASAYCQRKFLLWNRCIFLRSWRS
jgi:Tfp pilus assembly pilus retraction ATPase PilT